MKIIRSYATVLARFLISAVFLAGAVNKILHWRETELFLMSTFSDWQGSTYFSDEFQDFISVMISWIQLLMVISTLIELIGGLLVLIGIKEKLGASLLLIFLIPTTFFIHPFWLLDGGAQELQTTHFLKNLSIMGGLLMILLREPRHQYSPFPPDKF